jgi:hypothetical protein
VAWPGALSVAGITKVNTEALPIATGQNLKRLLSQRGLGRRPFPNGAAGVRLENMTRQAAIVSG